MKTILHFFEDEKFLVATINKFKINNRSLNLFVKVGHFKIKKVQSVYVISLPSSIINKLIPAFHLVSTTVVIHGFFNSILALDFLKLNSKMKILGVFWGFDLYSLRGEKSIYLKKNTLGSGESNLCFLNNLNSKKSIKFFQKRIDFVSTIVPNEFKILHQHFPYAKFKFLWFNYFDIENDVLKYKPEQEISIVGNNLLFGNNSSKWNNHLDGIEIIKSFKFEFEDIICPLSYSGTEEYKELIVEKFNDNFNERFKPINGFLKYPDYLNILCTCKFVFFNSKRQIGLGNLMFSLYLGSVVILDEENPLYNFFNSNNIKVFSIEEAKNKSSFDFNLEQTRMSLKSIWGETAVKNRISKLIETLTS